MKAPPARFPDLELLTLGLNTVMGGNGSNRGRVTVLHRSPAISASTYPSEIVTCRMGDHGELKLYCKYMAGLSPDGYGHRGGVPYESEVYRRILQPTPLSVPKFYGSYENVTTGDIWLILEYVEPSLRLAKGPQPETMLQAARWIGQFHAANQTRASNPAVSFLNAYGPEYYSGWVRRTLAFAGVWNRRFPWLRDLCQRWEEFASILLAAPPTIIHGEYYPHNILISGGVIYPLDWESAAIAAGEIDLATVTEEWNEEIVRECELEYRQARWPEGYPADFERRLAAARLYVCFRWLGDQPDWTAMESNLSYFEQLHSAGEKLGII